MIAFTFIFSFSYFWCIQPVNNLVLSVNTFMQELILIGGIVASVVSFIANGQSQCSSTAFGKMVTALAAVFAVSAIIIQVLKVWSYLSFTGSGRLPGIFNFLFKNGEQGNAVKPSAPA